MITAERIKRFAPNARAEYVEALTSAEGSAAIAEAGITTPLRVAHFMTQIGTETGLLTIVEENLSYSAERAHVVFPRYFPTVDAARPYARQPEKFANLVYDDAKRPKVSRLGNTKPGDGWRFRGRSFMQTTGRDNYERLGFVDNPDALLDAAVGLKAALEEWVRTGCNALADRDDLNALRRRINGGTNGIDEARRLLPIAKRIFAATGDGAAAPDWLSVQQRLRDLGYDPGKADGLIGSLTKGALLAFKADNDLPLSLDIDEPTRSALLSARPRPIAPERAAATVKDLRAEGSSTIAASDAVKVAGGALATTGAVAGAVKESGILDAAKQAGEIAGQVNEAVTPIKGLMRTFADMSWVLLVAGGLVVLYFGIWIARERLRKYRAAIR